jgi:hypothetical protein
LASEIASASPSNGMTAATGPKISSRAARASFATGHSTVGTNQKPGPSGALPRIATGSTPACGSSARTSSVAGSITFNIVSALVATSHLRSPQSNGLAMSPLSSAGEPVKPHTGDLVRIVRTDSPILVRMTGGGRLALNVLV